jgi:hypothetical protein
MVTSTRTSPVENVEPKSLKDATYILDSKLVTLANGIAEVEAAPGSASKIVTRYFGNELTRDLDGDGRDDTVFILTQQTGGSGVFYYVVAALNTEQGYVGSHGLLLGDRIAPQTTEMGKGSIVIINYADRKSGESFATQPSVGKSIWLLLDPKTMQFGEVVQNFEGERDAFSMTYIHTIGWPPEVTFTKEPFICSESGEDLMSTGKTEKKIIDTRTYCITKVTQCAAGSIYTQYSYVTLVEDKLLNLTFTLRFVQCANYDAPNKAVCELERENFDIDSIVDRMVKTM